MPIAATYLDDRIQSGVIPVAEGDGPSARVRVITIDDFASFAGDCSAHDEDGSVHRHAEICPKLNCRGGFHMGNEHRVWVHMHHLHAAGALLVDDQDNVRLSVPPQRPGEGWRFVSQGGESTPW